MERKNIRVRKKNRPLGGSSNSSLLRTKLESYARREQIMNLLMSGFDTEADMYFELGRVGIHLNNDDYMVWLIHCEDSRFGGAVSAGALDSSYKDIEAIASEIIGRSFNCVVQRVDYCLICIIGTDQIEAGSVTFVGDSIGFIDNLEATAQSIIELSAERSNLNVYIYMGRPHAGLRGVAESYTDANNIMNYCHLLKNDNPIVQYIDFEHMQKSAPVGHRSLQLVRAYIGYIERQNYTSACAALKSLVDYEFLNNPVPETVTLRLYAIYYLLVNTLELTTETPAQGIKEALIDSIISDKKLTLPDLKIKIDSVFDYISDYTRKAEESNWPAWLKPLLQYIDANSTDSNLSVNSIADKFGLTPAYMTKVVKEHIGTGLFEYIQRKRLESAISQIGAGRTMTSIAKQVGFSDLRAMRRAFRKFEDATPSEFTICSHIDIT